MAAVGFMAAAAPGVKGTAADTSAAAPVAVTVMTGGAVSQAAVATVAAATTADLAAATVADLTAVVVPAADRIAAGRMVVGIGKQLFQ
jgi:hypothetical protein